MMRYLHDCEDCNASWIDGYRVYRCPGCGGSCTNEFIEATGSDDHDEERGF